MEARYVIQFLLIMIGICAGLNSSAQINPHKIEQVDSLMAQKPKPLLILLSTDWCQYCALQKNQLQKNEYFHNHKDEFYFIEFDAERKDPIDFMGKTYHFRPKGINTGIHELVTIFTGNQSLSYPFWILLDENFKPVFRHNGILNNKQINELILAISKSLTKNSY
ncbi:thioredoxin fold domain-containing protein [Sphingobacterium sp. SGL-16]|uniref:thioredoxin fold domain-containing protein n=1 Tax=Sphingobacterium sp. SGL-16 TaxID=2710883 RepID=UPI0013ECAECC|nr:thioredoxin fold domain-containing protein [Sphingobacterium sp. SGL-16]NGM73408.1 hypothetical protein [Sphingobacterium sp. SGL-16]